MDSNNIIFNCKLSVIKACLVDGSLTKEEINKRLTYAVQNENKKCPAERDARFVITCEMILYEMHSGHPYISRKEECKEELKRRLGRKQCWLFRLLKAN